MGMVKMHTHFNYVHIPAPDQPNGRTLLLLHGTGGNEKDMLPLGRQLDPNAALLSPRGTVLEDGMARFFRRLSEGVFDEEDIRFRAFEMVEFVESAIKTYSLDAENIAAVGYSNGANIAVATMLLHPKVLSAAVLFRPTVPLVPEPLPDLSGIPIFVAAGSSDQLVSADETNRLIDMLSSSGADVSVNWNPGTHALSKEDVVAAKDWLDQH